MTSKPSLSVQIGGTHYKDCAIQPVEFIEANQLAFIEGCVVKRVTRHNKPTGKGRQDIEKAIHELQLLLELRYPIPAPTPAERVLASAIGVPAEVVAKDIREAMNTPANDNDQLHCCNGGSYNHQRCDGCMEFTR